MKMNFKEERDKYNSDLSLIALSKGNISPGFSSEIKTYNAVVPLSTSSINLTIKAKANNSIIKLNGNSIGIGQSTLL